MLKGNPRSACWEDVHPSTDRVTCLGTLNRCIGEALFIWEIPVPFTILGEVRTGSFSDSPGLVGII